MASKYRYYWDSDTLIVKYKGRRTITASLGNVDMVISVRTPPKKYAFVVTGSARARKGILPNSLSRLKGRWGFSPTKMNFIRKQLRDDYGNTHNVVIPEFDDNSSFNYSEPVHSQDGGLICNENLVTKMNF